MVWCCLRRGCDCKCVWFVDTKRVTSVLQADGKRLLLKRRNDPLRYFDRRYLDAVEKVIIKLKPMSSRNKLIFSFFEIRLYWIQEKN